jgi:hypothetical protein
MAKAVYYAPYPSSYTLLPSSPSSPLTKRHNPKGVLLSDVSFNIASREMLER